MGVYAYGLDSLNIKNYDICSFCFSKADSRLPLQFLAGWNKFWHFTIPFEYLVGFAWDFGFVSAVVLGPANRQCWGKKLWTNKQRYKYKANINGQRGKRRKDGVGEKKNSVISYHKRSNPGWSRAKRNLNGITQLVLKCLQKGKRGGGVWGKEEGCIIY